MCWYEAAGRRGRRHHAVELPARHDHRQDFAGACRGVHGRSEASAETPLSALALAELAVRAGVPAGVLNVVTGDAEAIGGELTANPLVRMIAFTARRKSASCSCGKRRDGEEARARARRQRAVHRVRRLRSRCGGCRRARFEIPQLGTNCVCADRILVKDTNPWPLRLEARGRGRRESSKSGRARKTA